MFASRLTAEILHQSALSACSTYYSFCGNAALQPGNARAGAFRTAICNKWLHPVAVKAHPAFSSWVLYGECKACWPVCSPLADLCPVG